MIRNILLHVHIFKNAGSSFDDALKSFFGNAFVDHREDVDLVRGKQKYLEKYLENHPKIKAFSSHSIHFIPEDNKFFKFHPVYFLRHPIDRVRSVYNFERKQTPATTQGAKKAKELEFQEYLRWYLKKESPATIRNAQTIFLSGDGPSPSDIDKKFVKAIKTLESSSLIGVVDRYDESMVVFEENLRVFFPMIDLSYIRRNVTDSNLHESVWDKSNKLLALLENDVKMELLEANTYDMELYNRANKLLDLEIGKIENFQRKLQDFKERCTLKLVMTLKKDEEQKNKIVGILESMARQSKNVKVHLELANALFESGRYKESLEVYKRAQATFPYNAWVFFGEIEPLIALNKRNEAKKLFNENINKFPDEIKIHNIYNMKLKS